MSGLAGALSDYPTSHKDARSSRTDLSREPSNPLAPALGYPSQSISPFAGQTSTNPSGYGPYPPQYASPFPPAAPATAAATAANPMYPMTHPGHPPHAGGPNPMHAFYGGQQYFPGQQQQPPYLYYPGPFAHAGGQSPGMPAHPSAYAPSYGRSTGFPSGHGPGSHPEEPMSGGGRRIGPHSTFATAYGYPPGSFLRPGSGPGKRSIAFGSRWFRLTWWTRPKRSAEAVRVRAPGRSHHPRGDRRGNPSSRAMPCGWATCRPGPGWGS